MYWVNFATMVACAGCDTQGYCNYEEIQQKRRMCTGCPGRAPEQPGRSSPTPSNLQSPETGAGLTRREEEVLRLMAEGEASKGIADELKISRNTVNHHRDAILKKLNVHNATAAVKWYWARKKGAYRL